MNPEVKTTAEAKPCMGKVRQLFLQRVNQAGREWNDSRTSRSDSAAGIQQDGAAGLCYIVYLIHSLRPRKEQEKGCSEKLTCTVQTDTPSFPTRQLRKLKRQIRTIKRRQKHPAQVTRCG